MALGEILNSLIIILIMIAPGFILGKLKIFQKVFFSGLSFFIINLCVPSLIIHSMQIEYTPVLMEGLAKTFLFWLPMLVFSAILALIFSKMFSANKKETVLTMSMLMISNTGFVGIPLINQLYGEESLFFASACEIVGDLFLFSIVFIIISMASGKETKIDFKSMLLNPPIIALVIGIILFVTNTTLPSFLGTPISYFSTATTPLALFVLGSQLSEIKLKDFFCDKRIYFICFLRLIIMPIIAFVMVRIIFKDTSLFSTVFIMMMGMPAASITVIFAQSSNCDVDFATKGVLLSTAFCLLTLPIFAYFV
jgi:predicted permease